MAESKKWAVVPHDGYMTDGDDAPVQIIDGDGNTVACNTTYYPTAITAEHAATIVVAVNGRAELLAALKAIEQGVGMHPENMRSIARQAISNAEATP